MHAGFVEQKEVSTHLLQVQPPGRAAAKFEVNKAAYQGGGRNQHNQLEAFLDCSVIGLLAGPTP